MPLNKVENQDNMSFGDNNNTFILCQSFRIAIIPFKMIFLLGVARRGCQEVDIIFINPMRGFVDFIFEAISKDFR